MSMWTVEAINAEIEYRHEVNTRLARGIRLGRALRRERAQERSLRRRAEPSAASRTGGPERRDVTARARGRATSGAAGRPESTVPAQRTPADRRTTQPV